MTTTRSPRRPQSAPSRSAQLPPAVPTGFAGLDCPPGVLHPGALTVLAGRPAMGATTLALQVVTHLSDCRDIKVHYHYPTRSLRGEPPLRWVALLRGENRRRLQGRGYDQQALRAMVAHPMIRFHPHVWLPTSGAIAMDLADDGCRRLVIADLRQDQYRARRAEHMADLAETVNRLEALALAYSVAVLVLVSLPYSINRRQDRRPRPADLQRAGIPLEHVTTSLFLYREGYYTGPGPDQGPTEVSIASPRRMRTHAVCLDFERERFVDPARR